MFHRSLVGIDVSLVKIASIIRAIASETSVNFYQTSRRNILDDNHLQSGGVIPKIAKLGETILSTE
jgi:hypothetical protein